MKTVLADLGIGLGSALLSTLLVGGALLLSLVEGMPVTAMSPQSSPTQPDLTALPTQSSPTITPTLTCQVPAGWESYIIQVGDTWESLSKQFGIQVEELRAGNCDYAGGLIPGLLLNKPIPSATPTITATISTTATSMNEEYTPTDEPTPAQATEPASQGCVPPRGWVTYIVRSGENLYQIGLRYNLSYTEMMQANCLRSEYVKTGQVLYVPYAVTDTPSPSSTPEPTDPPPPTPVPPSATPEPTTSAPTEGTTTEPTLAETTPSSGG
jgi:LysM repeat protein